MKYYHTAFISFLKASKYICIWGGIAITMLVFYKYQQMKVSVNIKRIITCQANIFFQVFMLQ